MKNRAIKIICVVSCTVLSLLFVLVMFFCAPSIAAIPEASGTVTQTDYTNNEMVTHTYNIGNDFTAVRIDDIMRLGKITKVNYVPNRFISPKRLSPYMQTVDLTEPFEFAEKGTLIFVILNLNPNDEDFYDKSTQLDQYKLGDYWRFTISLPKIFSACNIYNNNDLIARCGEIENYNFSDFNTAYNKTTENFSMQTTNTISQLKFYTRRTTMADPLISAQTITIHYQASGGAYSGISECPLIGTESAVNGTISKSQNLLIILAVLAAIVLGVLIALSLIKHTKELLSAIIWIFGIMALFFARFLLSGTTVAPLVWVAIWLASSFVILCGVLYSVCVNLNNIPTKYIFTVLSAAGGILAIICPFVTFFASVIIRTVCIVIKCICSIALIGFIGLATCKKDDERRTSQTVTSSVIAVGIFSSIFLPQVYPSSINPIFWLSAVTVISTLIGVVIMFKETETANAYLTANLHLEVERQIKDIKAVIAERDNLLRFVAHDMKKPLLSSINFIDTAIEREQDSEQIKTLQIIRQNDMRVVSNLSEIAAYAKFNYLAEPSQVVDLSELCALLFKYHQLDCHANGIVLKNNVGPVKAFVKKQGLENVLSNLIINAVEHANCSAITLSAKTDKNKIVLCVTDNGKGIDTGLDIFKPYVSERAETGGVGLYICKTIIESMNGKLSYESVYGNTVFFISLLKAQ